MTIKSETVILADGSEADVIRGTDAVRKLIEEHEKLKDEVRRAGIWTANLSFHAHDVKRKAEDFIRGVSATTWKTNEPRVVGFKLEFDAMVSAVAQPIPTLPPKA